MVAGRRPRGVPALAIACVALAALSLLWPHTLTYDPWSWAIWGRELAHGTLATAGGPSWKPLPVIVDSLLSLSGGAAPDLWLIVSRAGALMALVFTYRLAARASNPLAGALAVAWTVLIARRGFLFGWPTFFSAGWSEGLLVAAALGALDAHFERRRRLALLAWFAAALIRPEAGAFLLTYALLMARRDPSLRMLAAALVVAVPLLWLGPEYASSGRLLRGSERAQNDIPAAIAHARHPGLRDVALLRDLLSPPVAVGVALALGFTTRRTAGRRVVLALSGLAAAWLLVVAVMAEAGYPGIPRFLVVSVTALCVVASIGWAWAAHAVCGRVLRSATVLAIAAFNLVLLASQLGEMRHQLDQASYESRLNTQLIAVVTRAGGAASIRSCGPASTNPLEVPPLAWQLGYGSLVTARQARFGTVFRTRVYAQTVVRPAVPPPRAGFTLVAQVGLWQLYRRCRHH